ncbi:MAG: transporter, partial [Deltaproteobacteria bacterium]
MGKLLGREVAVVGVGMHPWGKFPKKSPHDLGVHAVLKALEDAGLQWRDIQYLVTSVTPEVKGNESILPGQVLCEKMGELAIPVINVSNVCGSGGVGI